MMGYGHFSHAPFYCLAVTYHHAHPLPHIATLSHWIGKHTINTTGKRIAQMVSNGGGYQIIESDTTNGHRPPFRV